MNTERRTFLASVAAFCVGLLLGRQEKPDFDERRAVLDWRTSRIITATVGRGEQLYCEPRHIAASDAPERSGKIVLRWYRLNRLPDCVSKNGGRILRYRLEKIT